MLKTRSEDSARSTQLDAEFKRKVERLLKSDHDDEIDLFPDILAVKKAEDAKARFIEQYGSKLKGRAIRNCNSNYTEIGLEGHRSRRTKSVFWGQNRSRRTKFLKRTGLEGQSHFGR